MNLNILTNKNRQTLQNPNKRLRRKPFEQGPLMKLNEAYKSVRIERVKACPNAYSNAGVIAANFTCESGDWGL